MAKKENGGQWYTCAGLLLFYTFIFRLSMMTATGLAARDPQMSHKPTFDGQMSPAAASKSVTSTKWRHWTTNSHDFSRNTVFIAPTYSRVRYRSPNFCPSVSPSVSPSVRSSVRQHLRRSLVFSTSEIAGSLKPCIVIVLDIPFKHAP